MNIANGTGLEYCTNLHYLYLYLNHISDISSIPNLANPTALYLQINQISDIDLFVQNEELGTGEWVDLTAQTPVLVYQLSDLR